MEGRATSSAAAVANSASASTTTEMDSRPSSTSSGEFSLGARGSRKECWASRDAYFQCCSEQKEDRSKCLPEKKVFDERCLPSWVRHFEILRFGPDTMTAEYAGSSRDNFTEAVPTGRRDVVATPPMTPAGVSLGGVRI
ncbi:unnamed protein product [Amoebophrya sp. A25]|nr:unnamed protein product [Amoebophrya sp. A25]|eukprot:GSA25T00005716001.1